MIRKSFEEFPKIPWFPKTYCQNIKTPCWIPHVANMIQSISSGLPTCDTLEKFTCMLATIKAAKYLTPSPCLRSCKSENYKALTRTADIESFTRVGIILFNTNILKIYQPQFRRETCTSLHSDSSMQVTQSSITRSVYSTT